MEVKEVCSWRFIPSFSSPFLGIAWCVQLKFTRPYALPLFPSPSSSLRSLWSLQTSGRPALNCICISSWFYFKVSFVNPMAIPPPFSTFRNWLSLFQRLLRAHLSPRVSVWRRQTLSTMETVWHRSVQENILLSSYRIKRKQFSPEPFCPSFSDKSLIPECLWALSSVDSPLSKLIFLAYGTFSLSLLKSSVPHVLHPLVYTGIISALIMFWPIISLLYTFLIFSEAPFSCPW